LAWKADDARGAADAFETPGDMLLLRAKALGREQLVGLGFSFHAETVHEADQLGVAAAARRAVGEVFGGRRIDRLAASFDEVALEELIFQQMMMPAAYHGLPPSSPRSFRAARNRCTRTVDSLSPVIALISRGVQSP
jgi:hypothetical protein